MTLILQNRPVIYDQAADRAEPASDCDCAVIEENLAQPVLPYPTIYSLELTPLCNNRCPGCSNVFVTDRRTRALIHPHAERVPLSAARWRTVLKTIAPHAQRLRLTGGEATLHPQFHQIVGMVKQQNLRFSLFTNGCWQQPEDVLALLQQSMQCQGLLISLHGATAAVHETFSGTAGSFHTTVANIRRAAQTDLAVYTNTVLTRQNWCQIEQIAALSQSLGARQAVFNRYVGIPRPGYTLTDDELRQASRAVSRLQQAGVPVKFGTCIPLCFVGTSSLGCLAGTAFCAIDPWGNVRPCSHAPQVAGNLLAQPLGHIWHAPAMQTWRQMLPADCRECSVFARCHGGCRADAQLNGSQHDPLMASPGAAGAYVPDREGFTP
jgi:radical SAM protein with 4Fe4S-binding SPASM domain